MSASSGLLWLELKLLPRWKIRPGQYLQLWMPRAGPRAWIHLPLLYVVICHNDDTHNIVRMVTRPHTGLMQSLYERSRVSSSSFHLPTTVLGPYGRPVDLLEYGTVVMVVEDIGFFRVLSYIEMLVEASRQRKALVRKLEILWQDDAVAGRSFSRYTEFELITYSLSSLGQEVETRDSESRFPWLQGPYSSQESVKHRLIPFSDFTVQNLLRRDHI